MTDKQAKQFDEDRTKLTESLTDVENRFNQTEPILRNLEHALTTEAAGKTTDGIIALSTGLSGLIQELALVKAQGASGDGHDSRHQLDLPKSAGHRAANRLDWMNNRATLVDAWRLIAFNANALKAGVNLTFNGGLGTINNNAVSFNGQNGDLRVGLAFDAPFTRRVERNNYRSQLIYYQQTRRTLYQFEDGVNFNLRQLIRVLEQYEINLEIQHEPW